MGLPRLLKAQQGSPGKPSRSPLRALIAVRALYYRPIQLPLHKVALLAPKRRMEKGSEWSLTTASCWRQTLGRDQGRTGGSATPVCPGAKNRQKKRRASMAQSQPGEGRLPTSERISPRNTLGSAPPPPQTPVSRRRTTSLPLERAGLPEAKPSMASSSPACSNTLTGMCYSTGQGACQQHANSPSDPPFQVGKTRLCSSTHSLPPTADTHTQPNTTASPFRLGQDQEHREAAERAGALLGTDQPQRHTRRG